MIKKVVAVAAATGGLVLAGAGMAIADSGAQGAAVHSPGVISGNVVQVPIHIPVNLCGNTISVIGLLNPAFGNTCVNA
ncbi:chaplin ChpH [Streptomyces sp. NBC_01387]|uniref:chaplin ChpH n=1 Tax=unclassified Streptomyces TaxID=2593676 RepID=UPI0020248164|nr:MULTISPECIES: chaplin ChpH [unclassified Streptomyces]MCX4552052.1 chaplin ChpH [Streptomyces sp. NBC_01500]WSC23400.1 chaplin ChpH [Streptomyces sp. NBC_01766]WSV57310.1 chaplin ChpH [Streptomyces sp. NBC_01014]